MELQSSCAQKKPHFSKALSGLVAVARGTLAFCLWAVFHLVLLAWYQKHPSEDLAMLISDVGLYSLRLKAGLELASLPVFVLVVNRADFLVLVARDGPRTHRWLLIQLLIMLPGVAGTIYFPVLTLRGLLEWLPGIGEMRVLGLAGTFAASLAGLLLVSIGAWTALFRRWSRAHGQASASGMDRRRG